MSSQKKKRIGSRRRVVNQDKPTEDDEFHVTEASAAQLSILGETTEVIDVSNNQDSSTAETPNPPSPEFTGSKRKLGSRRKNKGLHVKDFTAQLDHKEDVEEKTEGSETMRSTQMSLEAHAEKPEEGSHECVPETLVRRDSSLDAPTVLGSFEAQDSSSEKCPGTDIESSQPKSDNLTPDQEKTYSFQSEEIVISNPDGSDLPESEKLEETTEPFGISEVMSASVPSCSTVDPQLTDKLNDTGISEELSVVFSEIESEGRNIDSELLGHNAHFHDDYYQSESLIRDGSCIPQNTDLKYSALTPNDESLKDEGQNEDLNLVQHAVSNEKHEITHSFDSGIRDVRGNSNTLSESVTEEAQITDTFQSELSTLESRDVSAAKQEDLSPVEQENLEALGHEMDEDSSADSPGKISGVEKVDISPGEVNVTQSQEGDTEPSAEEQGHSEVEQSNSSPQVNQNVQLSVADYDHNFTVEALANSSDNEPIMATTLSSETETKTDGGLQDDSMKAVLSDVEPTLTENTSDDGKGSTRGDTLEDALEHFSLDFSLDGMQIGQSTFAEMLEEFGNVYSVTEKDGNQDTDLSLLDHSASELPLKSVNIQVTSEISAEEDSPRDSTDTECGIEEAVALPPNVENLSTKDEENEKVESSQGNEGQQEVQESLAKSYHDDEKGAWTNEETTQQVVAAERTAQEQDLEADPEEFNPISENHQDHVEREGDFQFEVSDTSVGLALDGMEKSPSHSTQHVGAFHHSENSASSFHEEEIQPAHIDAVTPPFESVLCDVMEHSEILSEKLMEQPEITDMCQSELGIVKSTDGSLSKQEELKSDDKQDEHVTEEKDSEALHQTKEECCVDDTKDLQAGGGLERAEAETGHIFKTEVQVEDETKTESMFSSQTLHSEIPANLDLSPTQLQQNDSVLNPIGSRRKLGSSRKKKLRQHAQDTDLSQPKEEATGNRSNHEPLDTTLPLTSETEVSDRVEANAHDGAHVDMSELGASGLHSSWTFDPQLSDPSTFPATEGKEGGEDSDLSWRAENSQPQVSESHMRSANTEASAELEITTDKSNPEKQDDVERSGGPTTLSEERKDQVNVAQDRGFLYSDDSGRRVDEDVDEPTQVREVLLADDPSVQRSESSAVIEEDITDSMLGEEVVLSETPVTNTEIEESSNGDDGDERKNPIKEANSLSYLTGYESLRIDSEQPAETDSHPSSDRSLGENITTNQANDLKDFVEEVGKPVDVQASGQDESVENSEDPTEKTQVVTIMPDIATADLFSSGPNRTEALDQLGLQENSGEGPTLNAAGASLNQQVDLDSGDSLQEQTKHKRRKMGSTRRTRTRRHDETDESRSSLQAGLNDFENVQEVEGPLVSVTTEVSQNESSEVAANPTQRHGSNKNSNVPDESAQSNMPEINVSAAVVKEEVDSVDMENGERNAAVILEKSKPDDLTGADVPSALNIGDVINADGSLDSVSETTQGAQNDEDRLESIALMQDQALKSAAELIVAENIEKVKSELGGENPNNVTEEVPDKNVEVRTASLKSENRRRKMGSTRKNLGSQRREEDLHRKQVEDGEATQAATNAAGTNTESLKTKDDGSIQAKAIVVETVEHSYTEESYSRPKVTFEEHQPSPSVAPETASTSPKPDAMSDTAAGGKRRKLGSHRKSQGYQRNRNQTTGGEEVTDTQNGGSESTFIDQSVTKTTEEESPGLDKISEVSRLFFFFLSKNISSSNQF